MRGAQVTLLIGWAACALLAAGCDWGGWALRRQPGYRGFDPTRAFADGAVARREPPGTASRTNGPVTDSGQLPAAEPELRDEEPVAVDEQLLRRGQDLYQVFCSPCHGLTGAGDGPVARRGFPAPPTYHQERLRQASDSYLLQVIREGLGKMPAYRSKVGPADRRAIVAYLRALQLSQHAPLEALPAEDRRLFEGTPR